MLKRINRLPADTRLVHSKTFSLPFVIIKKAPNSISISRFGFIISKKTAGKAVDRNRSKRLIRSCVEELLLQIPPGNDYLFIIKKDLSDLKRETVCEGVKEFITQNS